MFSITVPQNRTLLLGVCCLLLLSCPTEFGLPIGPLNAFSIFSACAQITYQAREYARIQFLGSRFSSANFRDWPQSGSRVENLKAFFREHSLTRMDAVEITKLLGKPDCSDIGQSTTSYCIAHYPNSTTYIDIQFDLQQRAVCHRLRSRLASGDWTTANILQSKL